MATLINKESGLAENVDQSALQEGTHEIPVIDPQGNPVTVGTPEDARRLFQQGARPMNPDELNNLLKKAHYSSQTGTALAEGLGRGVAGPLATAAETKLFKVAPKDIRGREEANPRAALTGELTGLVGSGLTGFGEGAALNALGEGVAKKVAEHVGESGLAQVAQAAARGAIENAAYQSGVEAHKMIAEDPDASAGSALAHVGLAGALGTGIGGGLGSAGALWKAAAGSKASTFLADFKNKLVEIAENPEPVSALTDELNNVHNAVKDTGEAFGLKNQEIAKMVPKDELAQQRIASQAASVSDKLQETISKLQKKSSMEGVADKLNSDLAEYQEALRDTQGDPAATFKALNDLKRKMQKYEFGFQPEFTPGANFKPLAHELRTNIMEALEDRSVWGRAADRQAEFNKAYAQFKTPLEDFQKKFTTEINGERVIDPGKIATYIKQLGKPNAEIKQEALSNFVDSLHNFVGQLRKTHVNLDLPTEELDALNTGLSRRTLERQGSGAKAADAFMRSGIGKAAGAVLGGISGSALGHPFIGMMVGEKLLGSELNKVLPALVKQFASKDVSAGGMKASVDYAAAAMKGDALLQKGVRSLFTGGREVLSSPSSSDIEKLKAKLDKVAANPEVMMQNKDMAHYMPEHAVALSAQTAGAVAYLQSLKPQSVKLAPLDQTLEPNKVAEARYKQALEIAHSPLLVLDKVKNGSITTNNLKDLSTMYPGLFNQMQKQLMKGLIDHKNKGNAVPYKTQLGLSMFMAQPMSSTMSPESIMSIQNSMHSMQQPQMQPTAPRGSRAHNFSNLVKLPNTMLNPIDAVGQRRQNRLR